LVTPRPSSLRKEEAGGDEGAEFEAEKKKALGD
jgi:hypothetical protein